MLTSYIILSKQQQCEQLKELYIVYCISLNNYDGK